MLARRNTFVRNWYKATSRMMTFKLRENDKIFIFLEDSGGMWKTLGLWAVQSLRKLKMNAEVKYDNGMGNHI
jgi:hypothetical protein